MVLFPLKAVATSSIDFVETVSAAPLKHHIIGVQNFITSHPGELKDPNPVNSQKQSAGGSGRLCGNFLHDKRDEEATKKRENIVYDPYARLLDVIAVHLNHEPQ
jgi:hypothetical protein